MNTQYTPVPKCAKPNVQPSSAARPVERALARKNSPASATTGAGQKWKGAKPRVATAPSSRASRKSRRRSAVMTGMRRGTAASRGKEVGRSRVSAWRDRHLQHLDAAVVRALHVEVELVDADGFATLGHVAE